MSDQSEWEGPERPTSIKVFGANAERINDGDLFRARVTYVEGRKVVRLLFGGMEDE